MSWTRGAIQQRHRPPGGRSSHEGARADEFIDSWVCWREACEDLRRAYECWGSADASERELAFESYRAALEREEQAALVHAISTDELQGGEG